jgi:hypothetical protein
MGILPASAEPVLFEGNGHYYEIIADPGTNYGSAEAAWNAANAAANMSQFAGAFGHLATITTAEEDEFIEGLRAAAKAANVLGAPAVWAGGYQVLPCTSGSPPNCGWTWVNMEGPFVYTNWQPNEPNDTGGDERFYTIGHSNIPGGNDEANQGNAGGYVVEYDTAVTFSGSECVPSCVYNGIEYSIDIQDPENETIEFQTFLREDDNQACGNATRNFTFNTLSGPVNTTMAKYLCGVKNPTTGKRQFVAVVVNKSFSSVRAADVETDPSVYFPSFSLSCNSPIPAGTDLRQQDILHFATDNVGEMPRSHSSDSTDGCGSSRGKTKGTILFVNTQYVFKDGSGTELDWTGNPESVEQAFIGVTRDRLEDLIKAIDDAKSSVPKKHKARWVAMRLLAGFARAAHHQGFYKIARAEVSAVNQILPTIAFSSGGPGADAVAFIEIWGSHLVFMYDVKVIPYAP